MPVTFSIRERLSSAFAVLCGRHGEVTHLAEERAQSRQALYREAERVVEDLEGAKRKAGSPNWSSVSRSSRRSLRNSSSGCNGPLRSPLTSRPSLPARPKPKG